MDPASLAIGVASIGLQVYTGCIQGIQLLVTALGYEDDCKYLNLRLRMEQQRLYAWSETSGLLDLDAKDPEKILTSDVFNMHRQTVLDLLVQIQCLFDEFTKQQKSHRHLETVNDEQGILESPDADAKAANFPMTKKKRDFLKKAMGDLKAKSQDGWARFKWTSFDKGAFEDLLARFSALNDSMTSILDHSLQVEIRHTVHDTNRGVLLLHHKVADLSNLVLALQSQLHTRGQAVHSSRISKLEREANTNALEQLSNLANFKAFNETIDPKSRSAKEGNAAPAKVLGLEEQAQKRNLFVPRYMITLDDAEDSSDAPRSSGSLRTANGRQKVWVEWKDYDTADQIPGALTKADIIDRVRKLAALLNHSPKPASFHTPHCLGFFDKADPNVPDDDVDILDKRLGLIFERPTDDVIDTEEQPVSLNDILQDKSKKQPRVTDRVKVAKALSSCLLYLHAVNWLHKGLRSHNILFWRLKDGSIDYSRPILSGFDFSRPGGSEEMTDIPSNDAWDDMYRHPKAQVNQGSNRERSRKSFDVYSFGLIMVELANWDVLQSILKLDIQRARGRPEVMRRVRQQILSEPWISNVGRLMGERYEEATRACLAGGEELDIGGNDDETDDEVARKLFMAFYNKVVKKLESIVV